jgi:hypothetical protein
MLPRIDVIRLSRYYAYATYQAGCRSAIEQGVNTVLEKDFDWQAFGCGGWADEYPGLRELLDQKAAKQKEKRDDQTK